MHVRQLIVVFMSFIMCVVLSDFTFCDDWVLNMDVILSLIICIDCFAFFLLFLEMICSSRPVEPEPPAGPSCAVCLQRDPGPLLTVAPGPLTHPQGHSS